MISPAEAMEIIQENLDNVVWTPDTLNRIAEILREAGYEVRDVDDNTP